MCTDSRPREDGEVEWMSEQKGYEPDERLDVDLGGLDWSQQKGREPLDQGTGAAVLRPRAATLLPFLLPSL
jgi:hypothetical protein